MTIDDLARSTLNPEYDPDWHEHWLATKLQHDTLNQSVRDTLAADAAHGQPRPEWWPADVHAEFRRLEALMSYYLWCRYPALEELHAAHAERLRAIVPSRAADIEELFAFNPDETPEQMRQRRRDAFAETLRRAQNLTRAH